MEDMNTIDAIRTIVHKLIDSCNNQLVQLQMMIQGLEMLEQVFQEK